MYKDTLHAVVPFPLAPERKIAVVGMPRSGTSWIARTMSLARSVSYTYEPEVPHKERFMQFYLPPERNDPGFFDFISEGINGRQQRPPDYRALSTSQLLRRPFARNLIVKWVRFPLVLDWIAVHFPELRVLQTVRHPIPLFLSWQKKGWPPYGGLERIKGHDALMDGPLVPYRTVINGVEGYWPTAAAFWCCYVTMQLAAMRDGWMLREHEWFCLDAHSRFAEVFAFFGLEWTSEVDAFLAGEYETGRGHDEPRDIRAEIHKWEGLVPDSALREVIEVMRAFDVPLYPDLDPEALVCERLESERMSNG